MTGFSEANAVAFARSKPRLLDLFCGAGGCAKGYQRAEFYVVGVDIKPQPNYCGDEFVQADALYFLDIATKGGNRSRFDAIHASPPCQAYTTMNNRWGSSSPPLIAETRSLLTDTGLPWVLENVAGARPAMVSPYRLTGEMFGLRVSRPRLFETNWPLMVPGPTLAQRDPVAVYGKNDQRRLWTRRDGTELRAATLEAGSDAMGIDWMDWDELREAVPPVYTEFVGAQLLAHLRYSEREAVATEEVAPVGEPTSMTDRRAVPDTEKGAELDAQSPESGDVRGGGA